MNDEETGDVFRGGARKTSPVSDPLDPPRRLYTVPLPGGRGLLLGDRTLVMAVVNVTPDSFAETSPSIDPQRALDVAQEAEAQGADLLDLGAESTRPGSQPVDGPEELRRLLPALRAVAARTSLPISIDTTKAAVAEAALDAGAAMVNDISGLRYDPGLGAVVARSGAALVLMHTRGRPRAMYDLAAYGDLAAEVRRELADSVAAAERAGVAREATIVDPGLGFAKRAEHSFEALARLSELVALDRPILVGSSRKSFLTRAIGDVPPAGRDWGTAACVVAAILGGAHIVRVHAVAPMVQVARVADEVVRWRVRQ
jgi:dihydropteroate synthase